MALGHAYDCLAVIEITRSNTVGTITGHFSVHICFPSFKIFFKKHFACDSHM